MKNKAMKYIWGLALMALGAAACSEEAIDNPVGELPDDGRLTVNYVIPKMTEVATRAVNEDDLASLTMLVFDDESDDASLVQVTPVTDFTGDKFEVTIDAPLRKNRDLYFVFVANSDVDFSALKGKTTTEVIATLSQNLTITSNGSQYITMSGKIDLHNLLLNDYTPICLYRNAAKLTVHDYTAPDSDSDYLDETAPYAYRLFGTASESSCVAGAYEKMAAPATVSLPASFDDAPVGVTYMHPTLNRGTTAECASYVIVKAAFPTGSSNMYYYRLDFKSPTAIYDIRPNHHYDFRILAVNGAGYATPEEAAKNPVSPSLKPSGDGSEIISYEIHDHAPVIYNMITDGNNELGVSHELLHSNHSNIRNTEVFYVKTLSLSAGDKVETLTADNISFDVQWMEVSGIEKVEGDEFVGTDFPADPDDSANSDKNDAGSVWKVTVKFTEPMEPGSLKGNVIVNWNGLQRTVPVTWDRTFVASDLFAAVTLHINQGINGYGDDDKTDYFSFLSTTVAGTSSTANNGWPRNEGFHFPVRYGNRYNYFYDIRYKDLYNGQPYRWRVSVTGDAVIRDNVKICQYQQTRGTTLLSGVQTCNAGEGPKFSLKFADSALENFTYGVGELILEVTPVGSDEWIAYTTDLYHCGFFNKESTDSYIYYEVVEMEGGRYWLDRNLGAHSAELYIETSAGDTYYGNPEAAGSYLRPATYQSGKYSDPLMDSNLCPEGFTYPSSDEWDALRKSPKFLNESRGYYYTSEYTTAYGKTVYFPKAGYKDASDVRQGESRAGYYWSKTASSGTEKLEIGNWLKCLMLTGTASSYINGQVSGKDGYQGFAMAVRCIDDSPANTTVQKTNFFVKGATHIYLYTVDKATGDRTAVETWPGKAIGSWDTVDKNWFNFIYESTAFSPEDLYVIFNYKEKSGKIISFSRGANGSGSRQTDAETPQDLRGWKVTGADCPAGLHTTALGDYWQCVRNAPTGTPAVIHNNEVLAPIADGMRRIIYHANGGSENWTVFCKAFNSSNNSQCNATNGAEMESYPGSEKWYYIDVKSEYNAVVFNNNGSWAAQKGDFYITTNDNPIYFDSSGITNDRP